MLVGKGGAEDLRMEIPDGAMGSSSEFNLGALGEYDEEQTEEEVHKNSGSRTGSSMEAQWHSIHHKLGMRSVACWNLEFELWALGEHEEEEEEHDEGQVSGCGTAK